LRKIAFGGHTGGGDRNNNAFGGGGFVSTSYGPPWTGIQGTGTTATGVNLKNAPRMYGIAVDPSVLELGHKYKVWPNPFGYRGAFKAFDTGGAIKGNRIDFYDWRGRRKQLAWGRRNVTVAAAGSKAAKRLTSKMKKSGRKSHLGIETDGRPDHTPFEGGWNPLTSPPALPTFTDTSTPSDTGSGEDPNQPLIDALNADAEAQKAAAEALQAVRDELGRYNNFASSVAGVTSTQAIKALADVISGQIVGVGLSSRASTASAGATVRY